MSLTRLKLQVPPLDRQAVGLRIRSARVSRKWRQRDLAQAIGVKPITISNWETGRRMPHSAMLVSLSIALKRRIWHLLVGDRKQPWRTEWHAGKS